MSDDIPTKTIVLQENIKSNRINIKVTSRCFYDFAVEMNTPKHIKFEELIRGFYDGVYIKPKFFDISFYFVNVDTTEQKLEQSIDSFGLKDNSYVIFLDEKKYLENSPGIKLIPYELNHQVNHFQQVPTYLDKKDTSSIISYSSYCKNNVKAYDYSNSNIDYLPIIMIKDEEYLPVLNFLKTYYKYQEYRKISTLVDKLIMKIDNNYKICHEPKSYEATFFTEVTDSNNYNVYNQSEIQNIIKQIKDQSKADKIYFQDNFKQDIEAWVRDIINILSEYIQFFKHVKPIYYTCKNCSYPSLFINKQEVIKKKEKIIKKLNKKINDNVNIMNCFVNLIIPSFFKGGKHPEINLLYHNEGEKDLIEADCDLFKKSISGCLVLSKKMEQLSLILKEIKGEYDKNNLIKFQLIVGGDSSQKVFDYIVKNGYLCIFDNMCILERKGNNNAYNKIKTNMAKNNKKIQIYNKIKSITDNFLKVICKNSKSVCYKYTKVINYKDYTEDYHIFHEKISKYYGQIEVSSFNYSLGIMEDFLKNVEEKDLKIQTESSKRKSLLKALEIFGDVADQNVDNYKDVLTKYTDEKDSFYQDINSWLRELDSLAYDKIGFFVSDLMFCLNEYGVFEEKGVVADTTLYRGTKLNYIDLLLYERNIGKIITLPSFTSTSVEKRVAENFSGRKDLNSNKGLFSVIFNIKIKDNENYCPAAFDIQGISKFESEKEILIQPFTFFRIKEVKTDLKLLKADIILEVIRKPEVLENYIKDKNKLTYNEKEDIVEVIIPVDEEEEKRKREEAKRRAEEEEKRRKEEEERRKLEEEERKRKEEEEKKRIEEEKKKLEVEIVYKAKNKKQIKIFGEKFVENNKNNLKVKINDVEQDLLSVYTNSSNSDSLKIRLIPKEMITNMSYMFYKVDSLTTPPDISKWNTSYVTDMSYMFYECESLESLPDFSDWNTSNVTNMSYMFYRCYQISSIPDFSKWNTGSVVDMSHMFQDCKLLKSLPDMSKWNVSKVKNMNNIFNRCQKLESLPDIKNWDIICVEDMTSMFQDCSSLKSLPDISNWNTSSLKKITGIFHDCKALEELPDISNWNISKCESLSYVFYGCKSLKELPDLSSWNTSGVYNMSYLFYGCKDLENLPDIANWNTSNVTNMSYMFEGCSSLTSLPKITKWDTFNVSDMTGMFDGCTNLSKIPSKFKEE